MTKWFSLGAIAAILLPVVGCASRSTVSGGSNFNLDTSIAEVQPPVQPSENIDDYFTLTRGPIVSARCTDQKDEVFHKYRKSRSKGERQINKLMQTQNETNQFRLYADSTWYDVSSRACSTCIDSEAYKLVTDELSQSGTQKVTLYSNTHYHGWGDNLEVKKRTLAGAERPIGDFDFFLEQTLELREQFEEVDYRIITPSGVYVLELNDAYSSMGETEIEEAKSFIKHGMSEMLHFYLDSNFRTEDLGISADASHADTNIAFCEYFNSNQDLFTFSFKPINSPQSPTFVPVE